MTDYGRPPSHPHLAAWPAPIALLQRRLADAEIAAAVARRDRALPELLLAEQRVRLLDRQLEAAKAAVLEREAALPRPPARRPAHRASGSCVVCGAPRPKHRVRFCSNGCQATAWAEGRVR